MLSSEAGGKFEVSRAIDRRRSGFRTRLIAGMTENRVIGDKGRIPWGRLPADIARLRALSVGRPLFMGSETARSMMAYQSPLLAQCPVFVLTRGPGEEFAAAGMHVVRSIDEASVRIRESGGAEMIVFGGGQVYEHCLGLDAVQEMDLTVVHAEMAGDAFFPAVPSDEWLEIAREPHAADLENPHAYTFLSYRRKEGQVLS